MLKRKKKEELALFTRKECGEKKKLRRKRNVRKNP